MGKGIRAEVSGAQMGPVTSWGGVESMKGGAPCEIFPDDDCFTCFGGIKEGKYCLVRSFRLTININILGFDVLFML